MAHHPNPTPRQNAKIECRPVRGDLETPPRLAQHFGDAKGCPYADVDARGVAPEVKRAHGRWIWGYFPRLSLMACTRQHSVGAPNVTPSPSKLTRYFENRAATPGEVGRCSSASQRPNSTVPSPPPTPTSQPPTMKNDGHRLDIMFSRAYSSEYTTKWRHKDRGTYLMCDRPPGRRRR